MEQAARGTFLRPLGLPNPQRNGAPGAKPVGAIPFEDLHRPGRQPEEVLVQPAVHLAQSLKRHPFGRCRSFRDVHRVAELPLQFPQVMPGGKRNSQIFECGDKRDSGRRGIRGDQEATFLKGKPPGRAGIFPRGYDAGDEMVPSLHVSLISPRFWRGAGSAPSQPPQPCRNPGRQSRCRQDG